MDVKLVSVFLVFLVQVCFGADPTLYEYYTAGGIKSGLKADSDDFILNGKKIIIFSGSLHYFRLPKAYWKDRLLKYKAAGLNAIEIYSPWNLHEETPGNFDFETGFLNLGDFLTAIKEADMFAMYRIGPFICAEWEMGGFPSWLLRDPNMRLRTNYKPYLTAVGKYFEKVLEIVNKFQFTKGGPIIAMQFENEFGGINNDNDKEYFTFMKDTITKSGFNELLYNCDPGDNAMRASRTLLPGVLETINFNDNSLQLLTEFRRVYPNKPLYVSEFWPGRFDYWGDPAHHTMSIEHFTNEVTDILFKGNSSLNFYMFFGGTNFGFMNGANVETSYDYNAPLLENANYTDKYWTAKQLYAKLTEEKGLAKIHLPDPPKMEPAEKYGVVKINDYISLDDLLSKIKPIQTTKATYMEFLNIGANYGQNFGFILYRITTKKFKQLKIQAGVSDRGIVLIDGKQVDIITSNKDYTLDTKDTQFSNATTHTLDIIVENTGRVNVGPELNTARKGMNGQVTIDQTVQSNFTIFPMEFKEKYVNELVALKGKPFEKVNSPAMYRAEFTLLIGHGAIRDTWLRLDNWVKGNVFINGFNVGRYYDIGPQKALYIPAPLLKFGKNEILVFELHSASNSIEFVDQPDLGPI